MAFLTILSFNRATKKKAQKAALHTCLYLCVALCLYVTLSVCTGVNAQQQINTKIMSQHTNTIQDENTKDFFNEAIMMEDNPNGTGNETNGTGNETNGTGNETNETNNEPDFLVDGSILQFIPFDKSEVQSVFFQGGSNAIQRMLLADEADINEVFYTYGFD